MSLQMSCLVVAALFAWQRQPDPLLDWDAALSAPLLQRCEVKYELLRAGPSQGARVEGVIRRQGPSWSHYQAIYDEDGALHLQVEQIVTDQLIHIQQRLGESPVVSGYLDARGGVNDEGFVFRPVKAVQVRLGFLFGFLEDSDLRLPQLLAEEPWKRSLEPKRLCRAEAEGVRYVIQFDDGAPLPVTLTRTTLQRDEWEYRVLKTERVNGVVLPVEFEYALAMRGVEFDRGVVRILEVRPLPEPTDPERPFGLTMQVDDPFPASLSDLPVPGRLHNLRLEPAVEDRFEPHRFENAPGSARWLMITGAVLVLAAALFLLWRSR